jgi:hypothetical protein
LKGPVFHRALFFCADAAVLPDAAIEHLIAAV